MEPGAADAQARDAPRAALVRARRPRGPVTGGSGRAVGGRVRPRTRPETVCVRSGARGAVVLKFSPRALPAFQKKGVAIVLLHLSVGVRVYVHT